jgi:hypothetical protein
MLLKAEEKRGVTERRTVFDLNLVKAEEKVSPNAGQSST